MKNSTGSILNVVRWIIAVFMWFMAIGSLTFGGVGIIGAILFSLINSSDRIYFGITMTLSDAVDGRILTAQEIHKVGFKGSI